MNFFQSNTGAATGSSEAGLLEGSPPDFAAPDGACARSGSPDKTRSGAECHAGHAPAGVLKPNRPPALDQPECGGCVLVPVAISEPIEETLAAASRLALKMGRGVTLLHLVRLNIAGEAFGIPRARLVGELAREAEARLREAVRTARPDVPVETLVSEGEPGPRILELASTLRAGAIVMRRRPHSGWVNWPRRNTSRHVSRDAPCPVWLLPATLADTELAPAPGKPRQAREPSAAAPAAPEWSRIAFSTPPRGG